jgi:hypothetical protein
MEERRRALSIRRHHGRADRHRRHGANTMTTTAFVFGMIIGAWIGIGLMCMLFMARSDDVDG